MKTIFRLKIINRKITFLTAVDKERIDNFIDDHNGLIFHETKFNEIASQTFNTKLSYFLAYENKRLVGICPFHSIKKGILSIGYSNNGSFEIPYGGWVYDREYTIFQKLWNRTSIGNFECLIYNSSFFEDIPEKIIKSSNKYRTGLIDLKYSEDNIFNKIVHSKRRNMIRKAIKSGIVLKKSGMEGLTEFYDLQRGLIKKTGLKDNPISYYEKIIKAYMPEKAMISIAYLKDKPLSGLVILGNKNVMHYWQSASASYAPNLGQGEMLQWEAIKWAKRSGAKYYDLCVIEPERLPLIAQFKMDFTQELVPFYCFSKKALFFRVSKRICNVLFNKKK